MRAWHRKLYDNRFIGITWPEEYGGRNASPLQEAILADELTRAGAPPTVNMLGITLCAPALLHYGSTAQKERYLRKLLSGEEIWCQGYSEPGSGSDLASLRTRAELTATTTWSTGRRCGPPTASTPTGCSAWCAPSPTRRSTRASASC